MGEGEHAPRIAEPTTVDCVFIEGVTIEVREDFLRIVGWIDLEAVEFEPPERRIVVRAAMPTRIARALIHDLRKAVSRGGH